MTATTDVIRVDQPRTSRLAAPGLTRAAAPENARPTRTGTIRMLVGHPCRLTGEVLVSSLSASGDFAAIKLMHGLDQLVEAARSWHPHVVLVAGAAGQEQLKLAAAIRQATPCGVVVVATEPSRAVVDTALHHGNISLLSHHASLSHLVHAVRGATMGCPTIDASFVSANDDGGTCPLSPREREVLLMTAEGAPIKEIAQRLFLTSGTVRNISSSAIKKLVARNRYEAARLAHSKGWL